ncbi:DUF6233 domain-containing protein [Actinacidiphila glaucinigra]|uniref:DUF6233 domain-containing protein n=1 Tax=Actinacidiphila glaucinigra TaxID=235986 RepID=UPI0037C8A164
MSDLPPDAERLRVIRLYLQLQIDAVDAKIREAEGREPRPAATPPKQETSHAKGGIGWRLQHLPKGGALHGVIHRGDCPDVVGGWLSPRELQIALGMPDIEACPRCHPERTAAGA